MIKPIGEMTLAEKVGQVIVVGGAIGGLGDTGGLDDALQLIQDNKAGGFYLGYPRYSDPYEARTIHATLQAASELPLFICGDMETSLGYIIINGVQRHPYLMGIGAARDADLARKLGGIVGREARAAGFNWNFGPCVDVNVLPDHPAIGIRAFGGDPALVSTMASAYIQGCESTRVICSAKHFPGQGFLAVDTHKAIGVDTTAREVLMAINLPPFQAAIRAGVKAIMSSHVIYPAFGHPSLPATLSPEIMQQLLRGVLGFRGLTITDSLSMKGIADNFGTRDAIVRSFIAGHDLLLVPASWNPYDTLIEAVELGEIPHRRLDEAVERVLHAKAWLYPQGYQEPPEEELREVFESAETRSTLTTLAMQSVTVVEERALPLTAGAKRRLFIVQERDEAYQFCPWEQDVLALAERIIRTKEPQATITRISMACSAEESQEIIQAAGEHDEVIFFCIVKHLIGYRGRLSPATNTLLSTLASERTTLIISLGSPFVLADIPQCAGFICAYGDSEICAKIALQALYGDAIPSGTLPATISEQYQLSHGQRA
jgi:beta-N-acetylhexosaminidase